MWNLRPTSHQLRLNPDVGLPQFGLITLLVCLVPFVTPRCVHYSMTLVLTNASNGERSTQSTEWIQTKRQMCASSEMCANSVQRSNTIEK